MLKIGMQVTYRDRSNRLRTGAIDKTSIRTGRKLYRVADRWFEKGALSRV